MLTTLKDQISVFWNKQPKPQRITLLALILAALVIVPMLVMWASKPSYVVAYSGLSETDAGQIVQKLDESQTAYTLKDNGTILVPSDQVYQVRLSMARDGLPKTSTVGYELFDGNLLGMTEFTQRVNYQRALEGELERTIGSLEAVETVRVHLVTPEKTLLTEDQQPATASATIKEKPGTSLDGAQVRAITNLIASSVEGLKPESVVVVDTNGQLLAGVSDGGLNSGQTDSQRAAEVAAGVEVKKKVESMLNKVLGPNSYVVQASVAMDWNQKEVTSSVFNPTPAAVRSSHNIQEAYNANGALVGGVPGAGSNLPTPVPGVTATGQPADYLRTEQTMNYEISQTETHEKVSPGQIKQVSVSIMVDNITDANKLASIKSAAAAAAGIDPKRGDQVVVESMGFDRTYYEEQTAALDQQAKTDQNIQMGLLGAGVFIALALLVFFMSSLKRLQKGSVEAWRPVLRPVSELALQQGDPIAQFNASLEASNMPAAQLASSYMPTKTDEEVLAEINAKNSGQGFPEDEQKARIVQRLTEESPTTVAEIIQIWLSEDERKNG